MEHLQSVTTSERFIHEALKIHAIELVLEGRALKSGRVSPYFFNSGLFNTGHTLSALAQAYTGVIHKNFYPDVLFGPAYKGIPLVAAVAVSLGSSVGYAFNRKEEKNHGEGGTIVGMSLQGKKVIVIDDVMTTGTSSGEAVEIIRANGGTPIGCVIAFDRQERGKDSDLSAVQEFQENYGVPVYAAATLSDFINYLQKCPAESSDDILGEMLDKILVYQKEYGAIYQ